MQEKEEEWLILTVFEEIFNSSLGTILKKDTGP